MGRPKIKVIGKRYDRLEVLTEVTSKEYKNGTLSRRFLCQCDCGNKKITEYSSLQSKHTRSCGCLRRQHKNSGVKTHGKSNHKLYRKWTDMIRTPENIWSHWRHDFLNFFNHCIDNGWHSNMRINRIDLFKGYCPSNLKLIPKIVKIKPLVAYKRKNSISGYVGISPIKKGVRPWKAEISYKKYIYLGSFHDIPSAINARNDYIIEHKLSQDKFSIQKYKGCHERNKDHN